MATPLTADQLLAALRAEGVRVVEHPGWRTNNRNHVGAWGPVNGAMLHHTVTGPGQDAVELCYGGHADLPGPLCHGVIERDGVVHLVGNGRANHAGGGDPNVLSAVVGESYGDRPPAPQEHQGSAGAVDGNAHFYGFECANLGDGVDPWPAVQVEAMVRASAALCRAHGWSDKSTIGHLEWSDWKSDPHGSGGVVEMPALRSRIAERLAHPADWNPNPTAPEDEMPDYVNLGVAQPYELPAGAAFSSIVFTNEWSDTADQHAVNGSVFALGPASFTGSLSLTLNGLPEGEVVQVRMSEYEGGTWRADHPTHDVVGNAGTTTAIVPLVKRLGPGRGMRVRLANQAGVPVTVSGAVLTALVFKET